MTAMMCGYGGDRDEMLVAYLNGDIETDDRAVFEAHVRSCAPCRAELAELRGVRGQLDQWAPPEPVPNSTRDWRPAADSRAHVWATLSRIPVWAQAAAALLLVAAAAGLANLNVRYDRGVLTVGTGWLASTAPQDRAAAAPQGVAQNPAPWRADLAALEQQLRTEIRASGAAVQAVSAQAGPGAGTAGTAGTPAHDAELVRRVRALVEQGERQQQRELALRVAQVVRDVNAQREADLVKIDRSLGVMQNNTGVEVMKQRELLNYLVRVSQKQ
jgi:hypothetical protein